MTGVGPRARDKGPAGGQEETVRQQHEEQKSGDEEKEHAKGRKAAVRCMAGALGP